jgi:hypothetical protein
MNTDYFISPIHTASSIRPGNLDDAITVFEAAVAGWVLDHARALTRSRYVGRKSAGFAILFLISSYFEGIEPYIVGVKSGKSHEVWRAGLRRVFPELAQVFDDVIDSIYGEVRCGLYHQMTSGPRFQIAPAGPPFDLKLDSTGNLIAALLNPWEILKRVEMHFATYISDLKNPANTQLRQNFAGYRGLNVQQPQLFGVTAMSRFP